MSVKTIALIFGVYAVGAALTGCAVAKKSNPPVASATWEARAHGGCKMSEDKKQMMMKMDCAIAEAMDSPPADPHAGHQPKP
jgi:hypothetical protein